MGLSHDQVVKLTIELDLGLGQPVAEIQALPPLKAMYSQPFSCRMPRICIIVFTTCGAEGSAL